MAADKSEESFTVKKHLEELFLLYYLMLIAIIEGVTFILIAENLFGPHAKESDVPWLAHWPYGIFSLAIVIITTFQYSIFLAIFRWTLRVWDTVFPFLLGFVQAVQTYYFDNAMVWWMMLSLLSLVAYVTMLITKNRIEQTQLVIADKNMIKRTINTMLWVLLASIVSSSAIAWAVYYFDAFAPYAWLLLFGPLVLLFLFLGNVNRGAKEVLKMTRAAPVTTEA